MKKVIVSPRMVDILKKCGLLFCISAFLVTVFYVILPSDVYPEFIVSSLRRGVKFLGAICWLSLVLMIMSHFHRFISVVVLNLLFLPSAFCLYLAYAFRMQLNYEIVTDIAETNQVEMLSFLNPTTISCIVVYFIVMCCLGCGLSKLRFNIPCKKLFLCLVFVMVVMATQLKISIPIVLPIFPLQYLVEHFTLYFKTDVVILKELSKLDDVKIEISGNVPDRKTLPIVFLHIGESARADHAPFNGYLRNTMPCVQKEYEAGNVISFPKCVSFSMHTRLSVLGILTPAGVLDPTMRHGSFIPYLNASGIGTYGFFSSMSDGGGYYESSLVKMTRKLREKNFSSGYSDTLHDSVFERISKMNAGEFIIYYGEGAHVPAECYNHEKFSKFKPDNRSFDQFDKETRVNSYDNCFVATDAFIGNAINALRDKNAVYVYVADHGDMLGENGYFSRSSKCYRRPEIRHVLAFVWASEKFQKENHEQWQQLKSNHTRIKVISHDYYYHSILSLFQVRNELYNPECDLFSPEAKEFPTEMPDAKSFGVLRFDGVEVKQWCGVDFDAMPVREKEDK